MTDRQAQTMGWAMKNSTWFLALRPTTKPTNSSVTLETLKTFLGRALPPEQGRRADLRRLPGEHSWVATAPSRLRTSASC